jgi:hypothetical protein
MNFEPELQAEVRSTTSQSSMEETEFRDKTDFLTSPDNHEKRPQHIFPRTTSVSELQSMIF